MADRGFIISESLGNTGEQLVIPSFTRGKKQLKPELDSSLPIDFLLNRYKSLITLDKIVLICCAPVNLCPSVVPFQ